jgi:Family of unknown function (DUF6491)
MRLFILSLAAPALLTACATSGEHEDRPKGVAKYADDPRLGEEVDRICFASTIDGFGNTTRDTFTVREGRDHYLIEVMGSCAPLDGAMRIGLDATGSCLGRHDAVIVSDSIADFGDPAPFSTQRCLVKSLHKWDPKAKAEESVEEDAES